MQALQSDAERLSRRNNIGAFDRTYLDGIGDVINDIMKLINVPGTVIVIAENGEMVYQKARVEPAVGPIIFIKPLE
jgi:hypothetical protein